MQTITNTDIKEYPLVSQGKVRDIYALDNETLLIVTTDRMSAFDVVLPDPIPYKGVVLNQLTVFWMEKYKDLVANHLLQTELNNFSSDLQKYSEQLEGRSVIVKRTNPLPIECIIRGYISGSGWKDYQKNGQVCGIDLPDGLRESDKLPEPLFTPSTKADMGDHDENITLEEAQAKIDDTVLDKVKKITLDIFNDASKLAEKNGLIIADTKFEFGLADQELYLIDEVLTPDSSRFWPLEQYTPGTSQPSFDKQYLRDWLKENWGESEEPPRLPREVIEETKSKYLEAYRLLTGKELLSS
mgnify:CR=1 FL=1